MTAKDLIEYWKRGASDDLDTAGKLIEAKKYHHALFFCQLSVEKILKGLIFRKSGKHSLPIHNLIKLSDQAGLNLNPNQHNDLKEITTWNIAARYDNIKFVFYKKATKEFAVQWYKKVKELYSWLLNQY